MARNDGSIVITGAAGFLGSHLCRALLDRGERIIGVDNMSTGRPASLAGIADSPGLTLMEGDVSESLNVDTPVKAVVHLACPASPTAFMRMPIDTLRVGSLGTLNALALAHANDARFLFASSSEVYGDPLVHPQDESYRGNVDPTGPRSVYDEAKRFGEAATTAYRRTFGTATAIVRPFNVYGPGMWPDDGRVVAAFCAAALRGQPLKLHGDGKQTRSLCYVDDLIGGLIALLDSDEAGPLNLGSEDEITMLDLAERIIAAAGTGRIEFLPPREQDVSVRRPDTSRARRLLSWQPTTSLRSGLAQTIAWMRSNLPGG
ncbi:MAG TPA: NAD-dependent epimerase/dehydratase family protein [Streptosporangiaceae bacterium]|jgi:nucleoside-diphosphate-sugar epimerase